MTSAQCGRDVVDKGRDVRGLIPDLNRSIENINLESFVFSSIVRGPTLATFLLFSGNIFRLIRKSGLAAKI